MVIVAAARRVGTALFGKDRRRATPSSTGRKFNGKNFVKAGYYRLKSDAMAKAKRERAKGSMARVVKEDGGYCVYTRG
jgi:hypothetical protein